MKRVFVSGCYDLLHAGHLEFFRSARALGDHLTVCFASDQVLTAHKNRRPAMPEGHKRALLEALEMVDEVVIGTDPELGLDFRTHFVERRPDILAVTEDDEFEQAKRALCRQVGAEYVVLPKAPPEFASISTTQICERIAAPSTVPLRVDFAGSWLDVPPLAQPGGFVVNCAITPGVSLHDWSYEREGGLGGSAAWALLNGQQAYDFEANVGAGWQDPAVIGETGLCVWRSSGRAELDFKRTGEMLAGRLALFWTGPREESTRQQRSWRHDRELRSLAEVSKQARQAVWLEDVDQLAEAVRQTYALQLAEGMTPLPIDGPLAVKYCGRGWGGYAVAIFASLADRDQRVGAGDESWRAIEPYCR